ncbi:C40 family peptidase [Streptomyces sp. YU58]|uniref:C40 family peptidase n=1 Tax=Streptomyces sp. SX92 TaxID=3158972 RepID=UPI0027B97D94|nr:NlpC/P60 family protein [Streptomyces coralus]WLW55567.1 NlpC/P60 family protein [Streptomyces coralus]
MEFLTVAQAADRLNTTTQAAYDALRRGDLERVPGEGIILLTGASVDAFARRRRSRAASGLTPATAARYLADHLRPPPEPLTVDGRSIATGEKPTPSAPPTREALRARRDAALTQMPALRAMFSADVLDAVLLPDGAGCRWCASDVPADEVFVTRDGDAVFRVLFGSEPCARDVARWDGQIAATERRRAAARAASDQTAADARMRQLALQFAELKLGAPYLKHADGPMSFDCSGLVRWAYAQAGGVLVPDSRGALPAAGQRIELAALEPGDLVINTDATHVGLYAGGGQVLHAAEGGVQHTGLEGFTGGLRLSRAGLVASGGEAVDSGSLAALTAMSALRAAAGEMGLK